MNHFFKHHRVVVDLWGYKVDTGAIGHRTYTADTLTNVFSSTKVW